MTVEVQSLHEFLDMDDGDYPNGPLVLAPDGKYYGTAQYGGPSFNGTVYSITADGIFTLLHSFNGQDGSGTNALVLGNDGSFYGTTVSGDYDTGLGEGTVFKITPAGELTTLHVFNGADGSSPVGTLVEGADGNFYGVTTNGGTPLDGYIGGTIYSISPQGAFTLLHSFNGWDDGMWPKSGLVRGPDGNFYGTIDFGNYTSRAFRVTPAGELTVLHAFQNLDNSEGLGLSGGLTLGDDGNFYGMTKEGGSFGHGTVYRMSPSGDVTTLYAFSGPDGEHPVSSLTPDGNSGFFGTTPTTVFSMDTGGALTTIVNAQPKNDPPNFTSLTLGNDGKLYGASPAGQLQLGTFTFTHNTPGSLFTVLPSESAPPPTMTLAVDRNAALVGDSVTLSWTSAMTTSCSNDLNVLDSSGSFDDTFIQPQENVLTVSCSGDGGTVTRSVKVMGYRTPNIYFSSYPDSAAVGQQVRLSWWGEFADTCVAVGGWSQAQTTYSEEYVTLASAGPNSFTISCSNPVATATKTIAVTGRTAAVELSANPTTVVVGQSTTLLWNTSDTTSCTASGAWSGNKALSDSVQVVVTQAGANSYTLTCNGAAKTVTVTGVSPPSISISANPGAVPIGATATLNWNANGATSCSASGKWTGAKAVAGSQIVTVSQSGANNYTLTCSNSAGTTAQSATVTGLSPAVVSLGANPTAVAIGANSTLTWSSTSATSCAASGAWSGAIATSGSQSVAASASGANSYTLTCTGAGGSDAKTVTVTGVPAPQGSLVATPTSAAVGSSSSLAWNITDAQSCSASGGWSGPLAASGTQSVTLTQTGANNFSLTCTGIGGTYQGSVAVTGYNPPAITFTATPASIAVGQDSVLTWSSVNAQTCNASGAWGGAKSLSGQHAVSLTTAGSASYTLTCNGMGGSATKTVAVTAIAAPVVSLAANPTSTAIGADTLLTWSSTDATLCTASGAWSGTLAIGGSQSVVVPASGANSYTLTCSGTGGTGAQTVSVTAVPSPVVSLSANPSSAAIGGNTTLTWSSIDASSCTASGTWSGARAINGSTSAAVAASGINSFMLTCTGIGGSTTQTVNVTGVPVPVVSLSADPASAAIGGSTTLIWSATDATSCAASGAWTGALGSTGSQSVTVPAAGSNSYTLACSGIGGNGTRTVTVSGVPSPTVTLSATPNPVNVGNSTQLTWTSTGAQTCVASDAWSGAQAVSGQVGLPVTSAGANNFTLTCTGVGGSDAKTVTVTGIPLPLINMTATPDSVIVGQTTHLAWTTSDAQVCDAVGDWNGARPTAGSEDVVVHVIGANNLYQLTCTGPGGTSRRHVTVSGRGAPAIFFNAGGTSFHTGDSATLNWNATYVQDCTASNAWSGSRALSGSQTITIAEGPATYTLTCSGADGSVEQSISVTGYPTPTMSFTANPNSLYTGESTTLTWNSTGLTGGCTASDAWSGLKASSGSETVVVNAAGWNSFLLNCQDPVGQRAYLASVKAQVPTTLNFTSSSSGVPVGQSVTLNWTTSNADSCSASGAWSGTKAVSGSQSVVISSSGNNQFGMACTGSGGYPITIVTVKGMPVVALSASPTAVKVGGTSKLTWSSSYSGSCTASGAWTGSQATSGTKTVTISSAGAKVYTLACTSVSGTTTVNTTVTGIAAPVVTLAANPTTVTVPQSTTLTWSATDTTSCTASGSWTGTKAASGSEGVAITSSGTKTMTLACTGVGGTTSKSTTVSGVLPPAPVVTLAANPASVIVGQNTTLTWSSSGATSCTASGTWTGAKALSGSADAAITSTGAKTFTLACTGAGGTTSKSATATGVTPVANFAAASESTTPGATSTTNITVTLSGPTSAAVTVPFTTGGTATTSSYTVVPSTKKLSFAAGATSATVTVNVTAAVCNKTVLLTLTTPTNATLGAAKTNTLTIKSATGCP